MNSWNAGYMSEIAYTHGYYGELNPLRMRLALLLAGHAPRAIHHACELGFGQGLSIGMHAAGAPVAWWGTDFHPEHAVNAQELASASGADLKVCDDAFAEYFTRPELPQFDFIALHGIWSWVSADNRRLIADFARRKLRDGGVMFVSYNTLPGWSAFAPMRHLMKLHEQQMVGPGESVTERVKRSVAFVEEVSQASTALAQAHPTLVARTGKLKVQDPHYLAHEYLNEHWNPMYFSQVHQELSDAKLSFACSANMLDHVEAINLSADQRQLLARQPGSLMRESLRDILVNQQFRREYWVRGARRLSPSEQALLLGQERVMLLPAADAVKMKVRGPAGEIQMSEQIYRPIIEQLQDGQPHAIAELGRAVQARGVGLAELREALTVLVGLGHVAPVNDEAALAAARPRTEALNQHLLRQAHHRGQAAYLASPLTGGAQPVGLVQQLLLAGLQAGRKGPADCAAYAAAALQAQGHNLLRAGKPLATPEEHQAELERTAQGFFKTLLPLLQRLRIA